eukprot:725552-Rhodomonas_salina.3
MTPAASHALLPREFKTRTTSHQWSSTLAGSRNDAPETPSRCPLPRRSLCTDEETLSLPPNFEGILLNPPLHSHRSGVCLYWVNAVIRCVLGLAGKRPDGQGNRDHPKILHRGGCATVRTTTSTTRFGWREASSFLFFRSESANSSEQGISQLSTPSPRVG